MTKLNLGCGSNKRPDCINVDRVLSVNPDLLHNLEITPWPWPRESCETIYATHVLEHLGQTPSVYLKIFKEIYRVLTFGGTLEVRVPHHHNDNFFGDPTHVRAITPQSLMLFSQTHNRECQTNGWPNTPLGLYLDIDLELVSTNYSLMPYWGQKLNNSQITESELQFALATHWNVADEVTMVLRKPAALGG